MNYELMEFPSPLSLSSSLSGSLCIGEIPVAVLTSGDPNTAPNGISSRVSASAMVDMGSGGVRRLGDMFAAVLADLSAKLSDADCREVDLVKRRAQAADARDLRFKELRAEFLTLQMQQNELTNRFVATGGAPGDGPPRAPYFTTRQPKVEFPIFSGEDLADWIIKCDHFFAVDLTPEDSKVRLAVINFEGRALQWFQLWSQYQDNAMATPWILFLQALEGRFGDHSLGDPMTELLSLKQTGSFSDYHDRFKLLLGRVILSETYAISHFINGLRPCVQTAVRLFMPRTLAHTYALARLQELSSSTREGFSHSSSSKRVTTDDASSSSKKVTTGDASSSSERVTTDAARNLGGSIVNNSPLLPTHIMPTIKTSGEMGCDEKLKQLYWLELEEDVVEGEIGENSKCGKATEDGNIGYEAMEDDKPLISINAISSFTTKVKSVMVDVAEMCDAMCTATTFTIDVLPLPVGNCDIVLGVQWPETLGDIQWNFKNLTMDFMLEGARYELRRGQKEQRISTVSEDELLSHCNGVQLCCIQVNEEGKSELELWAMVNSGEEETETPKCILEKLRTDHKTLAPLIEQKLTTLGQLSWLSKPTVVDFDITYKKRAENSVADALSRGPSSELFCVAIMSVSTDLYPLIAATGNADAQLQTLIQELQQDPMKNSKFYWVGGQLRRKCQLVVGDNANLSLRIIHLFHDTSTWGHFGILTTYQRISTLFYWPNIEKHIRKDLREGDICQGFKFDNNAYLGLLILDFIKGFPLSHGKSTILTVGDRLTKYVHPMSLAHTYTALSVAQALLDYVFKLHGSPTDFFKFQGVELHLSTAYHPQSDGQPEVVNRCLEAYLRCMCGAQLNDWSKRLSLAEFWYNISFHSATATTPFEALDGYFPPVLYFRGESVVHDVNESLMTKDAMMEMLKHHLGRAQHTKP